FWFTFGSFIVFYQIDQLIRPQNKGNKYRNEKEQYKKRYECHPNRKQWKIEIKLFINNEHIFCKQQDCFGKYQSYQDATNRRNKSYQQIFQKNHQPELPCRHAHQEKYTEFPFTRF